MNALDFVAFKQEGRKISMVTSYDYWSARLLNQTPIDVLLVGDSAGMVMHGFSSTLPVSLEMMVLHVAAVVRGAPEKFIVADMPFLTFRKSLSDNMLAVEKLMQAGAHAVKLEGIAGNEDLMRHIVQSGVPVMAHLGLTPQSVNQFGGFKVQGREQEARERLLEEALMVERCGAGSVVLECVPAALAIEISKRLTIPTIGIGAGVGCDGQVLVLQDLLGMNSSFKPRFVRQYLNGEELIREAVTRYHREVTEGAFPSEKESFS